MQRLRWRNIFSESIRSALFTILGLAAARFHTLVTAAPVGTRAAPVPENARRPDQNHFCNASMKLAPAGARLGTRVFCNKSWAAVRFSSSPGSLFILLIKRLDNKRARELWPRSSTYTDFLEFYGGVAVPLGPRALGSRAKRRLCRSSRSDGVAPSGAYFAYGAYVSCAHALKKLVSLIST